MSVSGLAAKNDLQYISFKIQVHNNNWPKVISYSKDLCVCSYDPFVKPSALFNLTDSSI